MIIVPCFHNFSFQLVSKLTSVFSLFFIIIRVNVSISSADRNSDFYKNIAKYSFTKF